MFDKRTLIVLMGMLALGATIDPDNICILLADGSKIVDDTNCAGYYTCKNGRAVASTCPNGYYFNKDRNDCVIKSLATCISTDIQPCAGIADGIFVAMAGSCTGYYYCNKEVAYAGECQNNLVFNPKEQKCQYKEEYKCIVTGDGNVDSEVMNDADVLCAYVQDGIFFGNAASCGTWLRCKDNNLQSGSCGGYVFNVQTQECVYEESYDCRQLNGDPSQTGGTPLGECKEETVTVINDKNRQNEVRADTCSSGSCDPDPGTGECPDGTVDETCTSETIDTAKCLEGSIEGICVSDPVNDGCPAGTKIETCSSSDTTVCTGEVINGNCITKPVSEGCPAGTNIESCSIPVSTVCTGEVINGNCITEPGSDGCPAGTKIESCSSSDTTVCTGEVINGNCITKPVSEGCPAGTNIESCSSSDDITECSGTIVGSCTVNADNGECPPETTVKTCKPDGTGGSGDGKPQPKKHKDPDSCASYLTCNNGKFSRSKCDSGQYFSLTDQKCTAREDAVNKCDRCEGTSLSFVNAYNDGCVGYYYCVNGRKAAENGCGDKYFFNEKIGACTKDNPKFKACLTDSYTNYDSMAKGQ